MTPPDRARDAQRKRALRAERGAFRIVPPCADRHRRSRLEADDIAWLMHYFDPASGCETPFTYEFTGQQREMIAAIRRAFDTSDDQAIAASRGEGKSTLAERMILKDIQTGEGRFGVLFASTGTAAENSLEAIRIEVETNNALCADYPEVCIPVRALENAPNRAHHQLVSGARRDNGQPFEKVSSKFSWCGQEVILPKVPGSPSSGSIIATRGLDSAVRGLKKRGMRPDRALIDDPDSEQTAESPEQGKKLERRIDRAIAGLGGQKRRVARVMLTTLQNRTCVSYRFTDPTQKPSWNGKRFRFLVRPPERADLWDDYVQRQQIDWQQATSTARELYEANRDAMDAGAEVANPNRFGDGELSALQHYYNLVARLGAEAVAAEYDNDPPELDGPAESGLTAHRIQLRLSGYPRKVVPPDCKLLTRGIDLRKPGAHWVVRAWRTDATNHTIDYGFHESHGTVYGSEEGVELAIRRAILELWEEQDEPYTYPDGEIVPIALTLVDSGWMAPAVYAACAQIGLGIYPAKGHGKSHGCATLNFTPHAKKTADVDPGDGWYRKRQSKAEAGAGLWLVHCDTDRWKAFEHARWLTPVGKPGAAYIFGDMTEEERRFIDQRMPKEAKEHHSYAHHLTAEIECEEVVRGLLRRRWKTKSGRVANHYLDASYLADVAAAMKGIRLLGQVAPPPATTTDGWFAAQNQNKKGAR